MSPGGNDKSSSGEGSVLSPEELDLAKDENVVALDDGRYVIGAGSGPPNAAVAANTTEEPRQPSVDPAQPTRQSQPPQPQQSQPPQPRRDQQDEGRTGEELDHQRVKEWQQKSVENVGSRYGFRITSKSEEEVNHHQMFSDDVGTVFDGLMMWYAQHLDRETQVEDVLGILFTESNTRVRYPPRAFKQLFLELGLGPDDTIVDMYRAITERNGVVFPPDEGSERLGSEK